MLFLGSGIYYILAYGIGESVNRAVSPTLIEHINLLPVNRILLYANLIFIIILLKTMPLIK